MNLLLHIVAILVLTAIPLTVLAEDAPDHTENATVNARPFLPPPQEIMFKMLDQAAFKPLFTPELSDAILEEGGWAFEEGELAAKGKGDIWTKARYGDFILTLEFKCAPDSNSGVFLRCGDLDDWLHTTIEVQIHQNNKDYENPKWHCGGIFDCLEPMKQMVREPGEWNTYLIIAKDNLMWVLLNQELVVSMDLDKWTEPHKNPDGTGNKFRNALKDMPRVGHIGLQYHGQAIRFRNLMIQPLD